MKILMTSYGTRGDVEPIAAIGRELQNRGHNVRLAVPPDLVGFTEAVGLAATACGPDSRAWTAACNEHSKYLFRPWRVTKLIRSSREAGKVGAQCWFGITETLMSLAGDADLLVTGMGFEGAAASVAEYYDLPWATLHYLPIRPNGQLLPLLPESIGRFALTIYDWLGWRGSRKLADSQRLEMGLPKTVSLEPRRIAERGTLEIQAYDEACFPELAAEWAALRDRRPFVGALTMEHPTDADDEVMSWIAAGTPPIFFGFGSLPVGSTSETLAMISRACMELGERALICSAASDFSQVPGFKHVKVVRAVNYARVFPSCRAVVHHGGSGTTAAGLRAGVPTLILLMDFGQTFWGARVKRLGVGITRRFSATTQKSLVADLRRILDPYVVTRAHNIATRMTEPADSATTAAGLLEDFASVERVG
jgi:UDP:flavonoid glycosyltransferase YjiC (YdhE family)